MSLRPTILGRATMLQSRKPKSSFHRVPMPFVQAPLSFSFSTFRRNMKSYSSSDSPIAAKTGGRFIRIVEVSPRDGLQNLPPPAVPTQTKLGLINRLLEAGVRNVEVGSFVRGDWVPQMADSATLLPQLRPASTIPAPPTAPPPAELSGIPPPSEIRLTEEEGRAWYPVLVPNMRGLDNLLKLEEENRSGRKGEKLTNEIAVFVSATEAFSQANNNSPVEKVLKGLEGVISKAKDNGYRVRGYVSCVMTCPYSGPTPIADVVRVSRRLADMGCYEISLGDTTGEGNPAKWVKLWKVLEQEGMDMDTIAAHCHDTFSMSLPSLMALLPLGLRSIDSSLSGLGGCPYSPGATGNVPTEDVVYMLHKMGYETGIDLGKLVVAGQWLSDELGVKNESRVGRAIYARKQAREAKSRKAQAVEHGVKNGEEATMGEVGALGKARL